MAKKNGRPTKFTKKIIPQMELLYRRGFTDLEAANILDISERTITNWKKRYPDFYKLVRSWKAEADEKVEQALYKMAIGYEHPETKIFCNNGEILKVETVKRYPPNTTACIFWLKNRKPGEWSDKVSTETSGNLNVNVVEFCDFQVTFPGGER